MRIAQKQTLFGDSRLVRSTVGLVAAAVLTLGLISSTFAATTTVVTPADPANWVDVSTGGATVDYVADNTSPYGDAALQLTTTSSSTDKANYKLTDVNVNLSQINDLAYSTKQVASSFEAGSASLQLDTCLYGMADDGSCLAGGDGPVWTNLVYEPYVSEGNSAVSSSDWQTWNVAVDGWLYSSGNRDIGDGSTDGHSGYETYQLTDLKNLYPNAVVRALALNVGSSNLNYVINVDGVTLNDTTYDFELTPVDTTAPDVTITSPTDGSMVQGDATLSATVADDGQLMRYHYYVVDANGNYVVGPRTVNTSESTVNFEQLVDTTEWADGDYTFRIEARDAAGNKEAGSVAEVDFQVNNIVDTKNDCKQGGWMSFLGADGRTFKNQGQCVAYVVSSDNSKHHRQ